MSDIGKVEEGSRWTVTPEDIEVGNHLIKVEVKDTDNRLLDTSETILVGWQIKMLVWKKTYECLLLGIV